MAKTVKCPKCGGRLTYEELCQHGIIWNVKRNGAICKRSKRKDYGSIEYGLLYCDGCGWKADEKEFAFDGEAVLLMDGGKSDDQID